MSSGSAARTRSALRVFGVFRSRKFTSALLNHEIGSEELKGASLNGADAVQEEPSSGDWSDDAIMLGVLFFLTPLVTNVAT